MREMGLSNKAVNFCINVKYKNEYWDSFALRVTNCIADELISSGATYF